jgi:predicted nucleic acid-binding protein
MTSDNRSYFVDANVLVYAAFKDDARHEVCKALLKDADRGVLHLSPQILAEFYSTVTSPKRVTTLQPGRSDRVHRDAAQL